ncbi:unnamed protein product [Rotaria sp. Silwood2]|nr:unnamed protein product [Rotaria sp. Silwood2]
MSSRIQDKATLKVALFPYIPDSGEDNYKGLLAFITKEFNQVSPDIVLELRPINFDDNFYDLDTLTTWLMSNGSGYDIVEIDTVLLGDLVNAGVLAPQIISSTSQADWHDAARMAVQMNNAIYGFPHLLCSFLLFTRDEQFTDVHIIDQLISILGNMSTESYRLVGNLDSSWDLPALWMNSYQGSHDSASDVTAHALHASMKSSFENMHKFIELCNRSSNENHCLDGTFRKYLDMPAILFAENRSLTMFGYSERLFHVLKHSKSEDYDNIKIIPMPIGSLQNTALFFTDAFVFRQNMSDDVLNGARLFVEFMATPRMQASIVASADKPNSIPRYLMPISMKAYDDPLLVKDTFYREYLRNLTGFSYPTVGFRNARKQIQEAILDYIGYVKNDTSTSSSSMSLLYIQLGNNILIHTLKLLPILYIFSIYA